MLARLDLPTAHFDDADAVIEAAVAQHDEKYHLTRLDFTGGSGWASLHNHSASGSRLRAGARCEHCMAVFVQLKSVALMV